MVSIYNMVTLSLTANERLSNRVHNYCKMAYFHQVKSSEERSQKPDYLVFWVKNEETLISSTVFTYL